jgi:hypothetical protein
MANSGVCPTPPLNEQNNTIVFGFSCTKFHSFDIRQFLGAVTSLINTVMGRDYRTAVSPVRFSTPLMPVYFYI